MNINRLLSRREKDGTHRRQKSRDKSSEKKSISAISAAFPKQDSKTKPLLQTTVETVLATITDTRTLFTTQTRPKSSDSGVISLFRSDPQKKLDKEQNAKIEAIREKLQQQGYSRIKDEQIAYSLLSKHADGNADRALDLVILFQESVEGVIKPYNPAVQMRGAENRGGVTCYLDALLFAMFARLGSFEPILYTNFEDEPRRRLSTLMRLWVNMLRTGMLIQTDITGHLIDAIAACGWEEAAKVEQQDTSEAFSFLTEKLQLPLLTLKMDLFHNGTEDATDDHKLIHERLLEVAVPEQPKDGRAVQLEDCLEAYFNNRVDVVRKLERSNTMSSIRSARQPSLDKSLTQRVEVTELEWSTPNTPLSAHPPATPTSPSIGRTRTDSIIRHRVIEDLKEKEGGASTHSDTASTHSSVRKGSIRKEVLMPAWQFFNLIRPSSLYFHLLSSSVPSPAPILIDEIAWYTTNSMPANDEEVAAHFSQTRPVLGICLKRYAMNDKGAATRQNTFIDIPVDIRLPHFVDEEMLNEDEGPLMGNFKLSLQSVICHRGNSLHQGHYISFIRGTTEGADGDSTSSRRLSSSSKPPSYAADNWMKHDDLASERVTYVDIEQALKDEMPYLLFYQVQPTFDIAPPTAIEPEPPAYEPEAAVNVQVSECSPMSLPKTEDGYFDGAVSKVSTKEELASPVRLSAEYDRPRRSINLSDERRGSVAVTEHSMTSATSSVRDAPISSTPPTPSKESTNPADETTAQRLSRAAARFKSGSRSRPTSSSGEGRISATFSRMALRSKEQLNLTRGTANKDLAPPVPSLGTLDGQTEEAEDSTAPNPAGDDSTPKRSRSIRAKKRDKSKEPPPQSDKGNKDSAYLLTLRGKRTKELPDRECTIM